MRGRDEDTGEFRGESRSIQRRDALEVLALGKALVALSAAQLARLPVPEDLLPHILETQRITPHVAHKRQLAFLAKQMRRENDEVLHTIRDALAKDGDAAHRETASLHRIEVLRDTLLGDDSDNAMTELLDAHPQADRQKLRQLVRNTHDEKKRNKPPHAYRELFHELKALLAQPEDRQEDSGADNA